MKILNSQENEEVVSHYFCAKRIVLESIEEPVRDGWLAKCGIPYAAKYFINIRGIAIEPLSASNKWCGRWLIDKGGFPKSHRPEPGA